ncbi:MAG: PD-(D/E)XK nuclease family protein [Treponema sp.]|nr:PD-(D/E)XK nuclease family protein [Treponema sp.]
MTITNKQNLPEGFVKAVTIERHNLPGSLSATTLLRGVKEIILTERHWDDLTDDVEDRIWAIFGTSVHALLQKEGDCDFSEENLSCEIDGKTVTGRIDNYDMKTGTVTDYKTASVWKVTYNNFSDWKKQGMIYAWLLHKNGFPVSIVRFIALLKDHSKSKAETKKDYPKHPVFMYRFPVTDDLLAEAETFIKTKLARYKAYELYDDDLIPGCDPEESWNGKKCGGYCLCKPFCNGGGE